jgi:hypothetical protein
VHALVKLDEEQTIVYAQVKEDALFALLFLIQAA